MEDDSHLIFITSAQSDNYFVLTYMSFIIHQNIHY